MLLRILWIKCIIYWSAFVGYLCILSLPSFRFSSPDIDIGLSWDMTGSSRPVFRCECWQQCPECRHKRRMTEVRKQKKWRSTLFPPVCYWTYLNFVVCWLLVWGVLALEGDMSIYLQDRHRGWCCVLRKASIGLQVDTVWHTKTSQSEHKTPRS
jgi:hypothetical protein